MDMTMNGEVQLAEPREVCDKLKIRNAPGRIPGGEELEKKKPRHRGSCGCQMKVGPVAGTFKAGHVAIRPAEWLQDISEGGGRVAGFAKGGGATVALAERTKAPC